MDSIQHQIALTLIPQVGAVTAKTLVSYCGSAEAVFRATKKELRKIPSIGPSTIDYIQTSEALQLAEREMEFMERYNVSALFYTHPQYPTRLQQCNDAPAILFFNGSNADLLNAERIISIVGTRQPTEPGKMICEELVDGLRKYNVLILSGLAYGIDITAHRKCCAINLPTIGVLGHGLGSIYPSQHRSVAQKMLENGGLLSEYTHDTKPERENFPMRNRIIAGMSDAVLVVETAASGGSMITAEIAIRYEKEVFAVPGRLADAKSAGCNYLIKNNKARLIENAADLAAVLQWDEKGRKSSQQMQLFFDLDPIERVVMDIIRNAPEIAIDQLSIAAQLSPGDLAARILALEFRGALKTLPGKRYVAVG